VTVARSTPSLLAALSEASNPETSLDRFHEGRAREEAELHSALLPFGIDVDDRWPASALLHRRSRIFHHTRLPLTAAEIDALTRDLDYKSYPNAPRLQLPQPAIRGDLERALTHRRSEREFASSPLPLSFVANGLGAACGLTQSDTSPPRRAAPSAGGLYPVETYLAALNVEGIDPALYHYRSLSHELEFLRPLSGPAELRPVLCQGFWGITPAIAILLAARLPRVQQKYSDRGYRFALLECGHIAQNLLLVATAEGFASIPVGGFVDDEMNRFLGIDGRDEVGLYMILVGNRPSHAP
jgi:SagB-type dehydrogenase family enzyme